MAELSPASFAFMRELYENNSRDWFEANRERYEAHIKEPMETLRDAISGPVSMMMPWVECEPKLSRIHNDLRFHKDKPPYKEHVWIKFPVGHGELFAAISRHGWSAGCMIGCGKREHLDYWRRNLIRHIDLWRDYANTIRFGMDVQLYVPESYKKPVLPDVPAPLTNLVQAKTLYLFTRERDNFADIPERDVLIALGRMVPAFLFMITPPDELEERLIALNDQVVAPFCGVAKAWSSFNEKK